MIHVSLSSWRGYHHHTRRLIFREAINAVVLFIFEASEHKLVLSCFLLVLHIELYSGRVKDHVETDLVKPIDEASELHHLDGLFELIEFDLTSDIGIELNEVFLRTREIFLAHSFK